MSDSSTTGGDGLHCVYGKCQGVPYGPYPCHPGCRFQMSAIPSIQQWADRAAAWISDDGQDDTKSVQRLHIP